MNEQNTKKILFNKSTLLSLKAELLKKQEEVYEKKQLPQHKLENFKPAPTKSSENNAKNVFSENSLHATDSEELAACRKAKLALEKKAELYEHLADGAGTSQLADRFLVDFSTKKLQATTTKEDLPPDAVESSYIDDDDDSDWTEFTDCLGRTRKCLKSDLHLFKEKDRDLMKVIHSGGNDPPPEETAKRIDELEPTERPAEQTLLMQKTNDYLQSLREKWEQKEQELLSKDKDIHYQDILFDEARMHGVAYYSFSTDEAERRKQMEALRREREETLRAQHAAGAQRRERDALLAARVAAARARQRVRAGLPPEDPQQEKQNFTTCLLEFLTQQKDEADAKAKETETKLREEQERERQKLREAYVREWDLGKDGVEDKVKPFRELTQEEYVEQQRSKRIEEFAPLQATTSRKSNYSFDERGNKTQNVGELQSAKTWSDVRPIISTVTTADGDELPEQKGLFFSTVMKPPSKMKYKNFVKAHDSIPIVNELNDEESESDQHRPEKRRLGSNHAEVAPPPTFDYYGPTSKNRKPEKPFESDIREAYSQGAKSLKSKASNCQLPKHYDFY